jgi:hypothetical protein
LSEFLEEKTIQRIVTGKEGGNVLSITNLDGEVIFAIKSAADPNNILPVPLTRLGFTNLLNKLLEIETEVVTQVPPKQIIKLPKTNNAGPKKSLLPENIDDLSDDSPKNVGGKKNGRSGPIIQPSKIWSKEEDQKLIDMVKGGIEDNEIAEIFGRSVSSIKNRKSIKKVSELVFGKKSPPGNYKSGIWSDDDLSELVKLSASGKSDMEIGLVLNRSPVSVRDKRRSTPIKKLIQAEKSRQKSFELEQEENNGAAN